MSESPAEGSGGEAGEPVLPASTHAGNGFKLGLSAVYFAAFLGIGLLIAAPGPCLRLFADRVGASLDQISSIFVGRALGYLAGTVCGGIALDKVPERANLMLSLGLIMTGVSSAAIALADSFPLLALLVGTQGITMGLLDTGGNVMLIRLHGAAAVEPFMQALHFFFGLGAFLSPLLLHQTLAQFGDYNAAFVIFGGYLAVVGIVLAPISSPAGPPKAEVDPKAASALLPSMHERPVVLSASIFLGVYVGLEVAFGAFIHLFAVEGPAGMASGTAQLLTSAYWGGIAAGRLIAVPLSLKLTAVQMMQLDLVGSCVGGVVLLMFQDSKVVLWAVAAGFGLCMASIFPTALNVAGTVIDVDGKVATFLVVGAAFGEMVSPFVTGLLFEHSGSSALPQVTVASTIAQAAIFVWMYKCVKRLQPNNGFEALDTSSQEVASEEVSMSVLETKR